MNLSEENKIVTRPYKTVYKDGDRIVKVFEKEHGKANIFNEALCHARVEESGLAIPEVLEVSKIDDKWALSIRYVEGDTLEALMKKNPDNLKEYLEQFVDLQLSMHAKKAPRLTLQKDKFTRKINSLKKEIDATTRYELCTRLNAMPTHTKLCHGDFSPENVIVGEDGSLTIIDWAHATIGNASAEAASTYLQFALKDQKVADLYLDLFCKKSDTAKQYVQSWLPIVAAVQLTKGIKEEKEFLLKWIDVIDFQ